MKFLTLWLIKKIEISHKIPEIWQKMPLVLSERLGSVFQENTEPS